jgi:predicted permease
MNGLLPDVRYAVRQLRKNRWFTAIAITTLGLGIGLSTTIFSLVDAIMLRPLPYPHPWQLVGLGQWRRPTGGEYVQTGVSAPNIADIATEKRIFQQVAYFRFNRFELKDGDQSKYLRGIKGSLDLLPMFGVEPLFGRFFRPAEMQAGQDQVAIIGNSLWQARFASDPTVLGKTIDLDKRPYTIIGVMPASFRFTWDQEEDVFVPLVLTPEEMSEAGRSTTRDLQTQARMQPGVSIAQAQAAMDTLAANLAKDHPQADQAWGIKVEPLHAAYYRGLKEPLLMIQGAALCVLLIACSNVISLLLASASARKREITIRSAIGASRRRIVAQLLTESSLLAALGGGSGLILAYLGDRLLTIEMLRYGLDRPNVHVIDIDWRVLAFSIAVMIATGVICGLTPALQSSRTDLSDCLKSGGTAVTDDRRHRHLHDVLVVVEIAMALALLTGGSLLVRGYMKLLHADLGVDPARTVRTAIVSGKDSSRSQRLLFYEQVLERLNHTPEVSAAAGEDFAGSVFIRPEGQPPAPKGQEPTADSIMVTPEYFKGITSRLIAGRSFSDDDAEGAPPAVIINETLARQYWPHSTPLGAHVTLLDAVYSGQSAGVSQPLEIVGIFKDLGVEALGPPRPVMLLPLRQYPDVPPYLLLRVQTALPVSSAIPAIRDAILAVDSKQQPDIALLSNEVARVYDGIRSLLLLLWISAFLALLMSAAGIFAVISYTVSRRTREIAVRLALGARYRDVLLEILQGALAMLLGGIVLGLLASVGVTRLMSSIEFFGIPGADALAFAMAALLLIATALLASYLPARRAAKVDPMVALRYE